MKTLIRLKIEKLIENNQEYFVATSNDLEGLVAEGKTIEEVIEIAQDVAKVLLELEQETTNQNINKSELNLANTWADWFEEVENIEPTNNNNQFNKYENILIDKYKKQQLKL